jgi:hypothetical protein
MVAATPGSATGEYLARVLRGEPLVPLDSVSFAEAAGRAPVNGNGHGPGRNGKTRGGAGATKAAPGKAGTSPSRRPAAVIR